MANSEPTRREERRASLFENRENTSGPMRIVSRKIDVSDPFCLFEFFQFLTLKSGRSCVHPPIGVLLLLLLLLLLLALCSSQCVIVKWGYSRHDSRVVNPDSSTSYQVPAFATAVQVSATDCAV